MPKASALVLREAVLMPWPARASSQVYSGPVSAAVISSRPSQGMVVALPSRMPVPWAALVAVPLGEASACEVSSPLGRATLPVCPVMSLSSAPFPVRSVAQVLHCESLLEQTRLVTPFDRLGLFLRQESKKLGNYVS